MPNQVVVTRETVRQARIEIDKALASVSAKLGVDFKLGRILFSPTGFRGKLEATARGVGGLPPTVPVNSEYVHLVRYGKTMLGANFDHTRAYMSPTLGRITFVGYSLRAKKYPFFVKNRQGAGYKITAKAAAAIVADGPLFE